MTGRARRVLATIGATAVGRLRRDLALVLVLAAVAGGLAAWSQAALRAGLDSIDAGAVEAVAAAGRSADLLVRAEVGADETELGAEPRFPSAEFLREARTWPARLPAGLRRTTASPSAVVVAPPHDLQRSAGDPAVTMSLAVPDRASAAGLRLVSGRQPRDAASGAEVVLTRRAAAGAGLGVGDALLLVPASSVLGERPVRLRIVGLVEPDRAAVRALGPDLPGFTTARRLIASGSAAGSAVVAFTTPTGTQRVSAAFHEALSGVLRLRAVPQRFDAGAVDRVGRLLDEAAAGSTSWSDQAAPLQVVSGAEVALAEFPTAAASAAGQQRVVIAGALAVGLLTLLLLAGALATARRGLLAVEWVRGSSAGSAAVRAGLESALLVVPAVVLGAAAAALAVPGPLQPLPLAAVLLTGVLAPAVAEGRGLARPAPRGLLLVGDLVLVVLAALALLVLQDGAGSPADPLPVAAPVLVALAAAVVVRRAAAVGAVLLRPLLLRGRGATAALVAGGRPGAAGPVVTAVAVAAAVAIGGAVLLGDLEAGRTAGSWRSVGADARVTGRLPDGAAERVRASSGVTAASAAHQDRDAVLVIGDANSPIRLLGVDGSWPGLVATTPESGIGRASALRLPGGAAGPLPILVAPLLADRVGRQGRVQVDGRSVAVRVAGVARGWPADDLARSGALVDAARLAEAVGRPDTRDLLLADGPGAATAVRGLGGAVMLRSDVVRAAERRALPAGVASAAGTASAVAALLALLALAVRLRSTAGARRQEAALLTVLGLRTAAVRRLLVARTAPPVLLAVLGGAAAGAVAARVLAPALGTGALAGVPSGAGPVLPVVGLSVVVALAAVLAAALLEPGGRGSAGITVLSTEGDPT